LLAKKENVTLVLGKNGKSRMAYGRDKRAIRAVTPQKAVRESWSFFFRDKAVSGELCREKRSSNSP
jgi:hypothetical protein